MIDRRPARILAMQALCLFDTLRGDFMAQLDEFLADEDPPDKVRDYARRLVIAATDNIDELDAALQAVSPNWQLARMAMVDRNILRIACCELRDDFDVPPKVVVNEAVEIAKAFGAAESPGFVNGVLDAILKRDASESGGQESQSTEPNEIDNDGSAT